MAIVDPSWLGTNAVTYDYSGHLLLYASAKNGSKPAEVGGVTIRSIGTTGNGGGIDPGKTLSEFTGISGITFTGSATTNTLGDGTTIWELYNGNVNKSWSTITWYSGSTDRLDSAFDAVVAGGYTADLTKKIVQMGSIPGASVFLLERKNGIINYPVHLHLVAVR